MVVIYVAGPIFTVAEQEWLGRVVGVLEAQAGVQVVWPFRDIPRGLDRRLAEVVDACVDGLRRADTMVAILDGPQVDDGTAWEMGFFFARNGASRIFGIRTDARAAGETRGLSVNTLVGATCAAIFNDVESVLLDARVLRASGLPTQE